MSRERSNVFFMDIWAVAGDAGFGSPERTAAPRPGDSSSMKQFQLLRSKAFTGIQESSPLLPVWQGGKVWPGPASKASKGRLMAWAMSLGA